MNKTTAKSLLRIIQSSTDRIEFPGSNVLLQFVQESGIGLIKGRKVIFNEGHKIRIRKWLEAEQIDPNSSPDVWNEASRSDAIRLGPDEKWAGIAVRSKRIAIKSFHGKPLNVSGNNLFLPLGANLEWDYSDAINFLLHTDVIVVENWEVFEHIDYLQVDFSRVSSNPLILWRGGSTSTAGSARRFLENYGRPVWSAPDYDPAGLAIAANLPWLAGVLAPSDKELSLLLKKSKLHQRFSDQLPGSLTTIESSVDPDIQRIWQLVFESKKALPQEALCRRSA
ncbi:DUF7281 domain-containing protein [Chitinibacter tainanensis]|uniref:DUF7281 domain-containing protein n=1 Tax=Chitinibacter tainanensis TaxID=230667 RepID=UPI0004284485|nr:hypothetical protein [Chitinibacter tainanensis]